MALRLNGSSSGYVELDVPAAAGSHTLTLPNSGGSSGNFLRTDGSGTLTWATPTDTNTNLTATAVATASGQYMEFTNIPSDVLRLTYVLDQVSCNSTVNLGLQIGDSGGYETSGYTGSGYYQNTTTSQSYSSDSTGWWIPITNTSNTISGSFKLHRLSSTEWVCDMHGFDNNFNLTCGTGGAKTLSGTLDRVRVGWKSGSFDSGQVRVFYEV